MSMVGNLARIPNATLEMLHKHPRLITRLLYPNLPDPPEREAGWLARLLGRKSVPGVRTPLPHLQPLAESDSFYIDKAWHGLHFLFTGSASEGEFPAGFLVTCGTPIGDIDVGYGPARSFTPAEVQSIAAFLDDQDEAQLKSRIDPEVMQNLEIYPSVWSEDTSIEEEWEYLVSTFRGMKEFVRHASLGQLAMIVYVN